jgi:undecaprenol kinase
MVSNKNKGFKSALLNASSGFRYALSREKNLKFHFLTGFIVIVVSWVLHLSISEWCVIFITISAVFVAELINTAIEYTVDIASPEKQELARRAKDVSAAAVLVVAICAVAVGILIFLPKILPLF